MSKIPYVLVLVALACTPVTEPEPVDFGAPYRVEVTLDPPVLDATSLSVTVSYGACGSNHEFELKHRSRADDEVDVWLRKLTPDEPCEKLVVERREFQVPMAVQDAAVVTLLAPNDEAYELRP